MNEEVWVISLGGSRIIPGKNVDEQFLKQFKKIISKNKDKKFVVVTGGGTTARKYIKALQDFKKEIGLQSEAGVAITRFHAIFLMRLFGKSANHILPLTKKRVKNLLSKNQIVFCGALKQKTKQTTDGTAASIAAYLKAPFINITNVEGLYTKDPKKSKKAKLIKTITWKEFYNLSKKIKFKAGQHFVLDQSAAKRIMKYKIKTYILGSLKELEKLIAQKNFKGTIINE